MDEYLTDKFSPKIPTKYFLSIHGKIWILANEMSASFWMESFPKPYVRSMNFIGQIDQWSSYVRSGKFIGQIFRYPLLLPWTKRQCMVSCFLTFLLYFGICDMNTKTHINPCSESCQNWTLFRLLEHSRCHARARVSRHCYRSFVRRGNFIFDGAWLIDLFCMCEAQTLAVMCCFEICYFIFACM